MSILAPEPENNTDSPARRKAIPRRLRFEVLRRDDNTCRYCHATDAPLTIDHVVPVALGGSNDPANLVAACVDCNAGKSSSNPDAPLVAQVDEDSLRWSAAMQESSRRMLEDLEAENEYTAAVDRIWKRWNTNGEQVPRPQGWWNSVSQWRAAGLPLAIIEDAVQRAMGNSRVDVDEVWRYFCGIVWRRVKELQATAQAEFAHVPSGAAFQRAVVASRRAFPWANDPLLDHESREVARLVLQPMRHLSHLQAKALSRVVDGPEPWNENPALAELARGL